MKKSNVLNGSLVTDLGITMLRVFIGTALFVKGIYYMINMQELESLTLMNMPFSSFIAAHYVIFAHVIGGTCLIVGLLTRIAAVFNIPVLLGAIIFVHAKEGLFTKNQGLELTIFLLVTLCVLTLTGSKLFTVDNAIQNKNIGQDEFSYEDFTKAA